MLSTDHSCCLCNGYQPDHWIVGWLALRLSACEFGSAGAGLPFVMRSDRMADAMREMCFEAELLVSTGSPPEVASTLGDIAPECFKAWAFCECMVG